MSNKEPAGTEENWASTGREADRRSYATIGDTPNSKAYGNSPRVLLKRCSDDENDQVVVKRRSIAGGENKSGTRARDERVSPVLRDIAGSGLSDANGDG